MGNTGKEGHGVASGRALHVRGCMQCWVWQDKGVEVGMTWRWRAIHDHHPPPPGPQELVDAYTEAEIRPTDCRGRALLPRCPRVLCWDVLARSDEFSMWLRSPSPRCEPWFLESIRLGAYIPAFVSHHSLVLNTSDNTGNS